MATHYVIISVFNSGFSDVVMDVAREAGANGGTIIDARGSATKDLEAKFGFVLNSDKEIAMIVVTEAMKDPILTAIYQQVTKVNVAAQCFTFCLPVDEIAGLGAYIKEKDN